MKLYIDTNIYLSYVNPSSDIKSLEKLKKLIQTNKVELILPSQTKEEFLRHFKERINQAKDKLKKTETTVGIPNELKNEKRKKYTTEESEIIKKIDLLNDDLKKYRIQKITELKKHVESTEKLINDIFELATFFDYTDDVILRAVTRYAKGLPPRKENFKFGDAIIWETLKENIRREEIVIVSVDSDFSQKIGKNFSINKTLLAEWKKHTGKKASLYSVLGQFVNTLDKIDPVSPETIKKETQQAATVYLNSPQSVVTNGNGGYFTVNNTTENILGSPLSMGNKYYNYDNAIVPNFGNANLYYTNDGTKISTSDIITNNSNSSIFHILNPDTGINKISFGSFCKICGKRYPESLTTVNINGLCDTCSNLDGTNWKNPFFTNN